MALQVTRTAGQIAHATEKLAPLVNRNNVNSIVIFTMPALLSGIVIGSCYTLSFKEELSLNVAIEIGILVGLAAYFFQYLTTKRNPYQFKKNPKNGM